MNYSYRVYGVTLGSDVAIPGPTQVPTNGENFDVIVSLGSRPQWLPEAAQLPFPVNLPNEDAHGKGAPVFTLISFGDGEFFELTYREGARFVVDRAGKRVWGTCLPPLTIEDIGTYLLGPVMGFVLRCQGIVSLHASAVCMQGQAVLLCGESETGKSTTAAALALRGIPVLCEDISPLFECANGFQIKPGYPRVCLWPDAVRILLGTADALPQLTPTWEKYFLPLDGIRAKFEERSKLLGAVYLLSSRVAGENVLRMQEVSAPAALLGLVKNTYMNRLLDRTQRAAEFDVLSRMVMQVPVRRIVPHIDPARIGALCDLIVEDATRLLPPRPAAATTFGP